MQMTLNFKFLHENICLSLRNMSETIDDAQTNWICIFKELLEFTKRVIILKNTLAYEHETSTNNVN